MSSTNFNPTTNNRRPQFSRIPRHDESIDSFVERLDLLGYGPVPSWIRRWYAFAAFCASLWRACATSCARLWRACVDFIFHNFSISSFALFAFCNFDFVRAIGATFIFYLAYLSLTSPNARPLLPVARDARRDGFPLQPAIFTAVAISLFFLLAFEIATGALLIFAVLILSLRSGRMSLIHGSRNGSRFCCLIALIFVCVYIFGIWSGVVIHNKFRLPQETAHQLN